MKFKNILVFCCIALLHTGVNATAYKLIENNGRQIIPLTSNWDFYFAYNFEQHIEKERVSLPHTWNAQDVIKGLADYKRTSARYERILYMPVEWKEKRQFLHFEGVNSVATVFVNNKLVTIHHGGYTAFSAEITDYLKEGDNLIMVDVSNAHRLDVLPLHGDFNVYGGIHRPVSLLITDKNCISPIDFGSSGVYITQRKVSTVEAEIVIKTKLLLSAYNGLRIESRIIDKVGKVVNVQTNLLEAKDNDELIQSLKIIRPHLWNGKADPYLYRVEVTLLRNNQVLDQIVQPLGLRFFHVDPEKGFFLNGKYLDLYGVGRHEDVYGKGSALTDEDQEVDMNLIKDLGATAARLTHYPHSKHFYDLCDQNGIILWSEIPFVGPGGYTGTGYVNSPELRENATQMLTELIRQNYNHPSICFWGLFNELKLDFDDPQAFIKELGTLAKREDPTRLTTLASNLNAETFTDLTDLMGWNKYYGWYGGRFEEIGAWADKTHLALPLKPISVSEYGAGASPFKHTEELSAPDPKGRFHPEEWQTAFHQKHWESLKSRPFIWGKFIWVLADFGSSIRTEGDENGINDKGLVTYDRKIKKDAFFFYKANWNTDPILYIAERRNDSRHKALTHIKVFSNLLQVSLWVNGKSIGQKKKDAYNTILWEDVRLKKGVNKIVVKGRSGNELITDSCDWELIEI